MRSGFSYSDAVKLLGGDTDAAKLIDRLSSAGVLLTGGIDLIDARTEIVRLGKDVVRSVRARVQGTSRLARTQLLEAAHSVLVVTAFFDALASLDLPLDVTLSKPEQLGVLSADPVPVSRTADLVGELLRWDTPQPSAEWPFPELVAALTTQYRLRVRTFVSFVSGLAGWESLDPRRREAFVATVSSELADHAIARYEDMYRQLAVDCPEFSVWTQLSEHAATRARLDDLRALLERVTSGEEPDQRRLGLAKAYEDALRQPLVEAGDLPRDLVLPPLREAYVPPLFKVAEVTREDDMSFESWWEGVSQRGDLQDYLAGYFTSSRAITAPLVVLGHPGSGKSVLTKMVAASLPSADFLPIRVVLRDVPAEADLQEQIEYAIRDATGERIDWPDLARSAGAAVPVVLLDGFDELLQATGVSRSDYLTKIADFQRRERTQDRAAIFVVTSRIAVAHRARVPEGTTALRLEPFGEQQVARWLEVWNAANADYFRVNSLAPLAPAAAMKFASLAEQPLLLFMLALYDLDHNALRQDREIQQTQLYEGLLGRFALREVVRQAGGASDEEVQARVEQELVSLSIVAMAMFNRGTQWVDEASLDADLEALFGSAEQERDVRARLSAAQLLLGRFFFVHEACATRDDTRVQTYEFLHATFGEYLVARLVHRVLFDVFHQQQAVPKSPFGGSRCDDTMLYTLLSFTPLTTRGGVVEFLAELSDKLQSRTRDALRGLLYQLLNDAQHARSDASHSRYQPRQRTVTGRIAAYSANIATLIYLVGQRSPMAGFREQGREAEWANLTYLWRSQLSAEEWASLVGFMVQVPLSAGYQRAAIHALVDDSLMHTAGRLDLTTLAAVPLIEAMPLAFDRTERAGQRTVSPAHLLLRSWLEQGDRAERDATYQSCLLARAGSDISTRLLLRIIAQDEGVSTDVALLALFVGVHFGAHPDLLFQLAISILARGEHKVVVFHAMDGVASWTDGGPSPAGARALVQLIELGHQDDLGRVHEFADPVAYLNRRGFLERVVEEDPALYTRLRWAMQEIGLADRVNWL